VGEPRAGLKSVPWVLLGWKVSFSKKNNFNWPWLDEITVGHEVWDRSSFESGRSHGRAKEIELENPSIFWRESWEKRGVNS
jgi:hypothetical protein